MWTAASTHRSTTAARPAERRPRSTPAASQRVSSPPIAPSACAAAWALPGSKASRYSWRPGSLADNDDTSVTTPASAVASAASLLVMTEVYRGARECFMNVSLARCAQYVEDRLPELVVPRRPGVVVVADRRGAAGPRQRADVVDRERHGPVAGERAAVGEVLRGEARGGVGHRDARVAVDRRDELIEVADGRQRAPRRAAAVCAVQPQRQELVVVDEPDDRRRRRRRGPQPPGDLRQVLADGRLAAPEAGGAGGAGVAVDARLDVVVADVDRDQDGVAVGGEDVLRALELAGLAVGTAALAAVQQRDRRRAATAERAALQAGVRAGQRARDHVDVALAGRAIGALPVGLHPRGERIAQGEVQRRRLACRGALARRGGRERVRCEEREPPADRGEHPNEVITGSQSDAIRG